MAYIWFMTIEAASEEAARQLAARIDRSTLRVGSSSIELAINVEFKDNNWWGITLLPFYSGRGGAVAERGGAESEEHAKLLTDIGNALYDRLLQAGPFEMATVGFECESFFGFGSSEREDLLRDLRAGETFDGLVLSKELWERADRPNALVPRDDGTYWTPWQGERCGRG